MLIKFTKFRFFVEMHPLLVFNANFKWIWTLHNNCDVLHVGNAIPRAQKCFSCSCKFTWTHTTFSIFQYSLIFAHWFFFLIYFGIRLAFLWTVLLLDKSNARFSPLQNVLIFRKCGILYFNLIFFFRVFYFRDPSGVRFRNRMKWEGEE